MPPQIGPCVVIADDLTGACDAAAQFRLRGAETTVFLRDTGLPDRARGVLAFSTDSRHCAPEEAEARLRDIAARAMRLQPRTVFKKIDSVFRGNPGAEIRAALDAFECDLAIITPAFPEMGRTVSEGYLHVYTDASWVPLDIAAKLREQGLEKCTHVAASALFAAIESGARVLSLDATCNEDLRTIAANALRSGRHILWAGSAGLASGLAHALFGPDIHPARPEPEKGPVLFCLGSNHPATTVQLAELASARVAPCLHADAVTPETLIDCLQDGEHTILNISRGHTSVDYLRALLRPVHNLVIALLMSGGDTASLVCRAIEAESISIQGEIVTGLPWGMIESRSFGRLPVATKSGGFGQPDALIQVADFFTCGKI